MKRTKRNGDKLWNELLGTLTHKKYLSTYNLLGKRRFKKVQFFDHHNLGDGLDNHISIYIDNETPWEIYLSKDGTWTLI